MQEQQLRHTQRSVSTSEQVGTRHPADGWDFELVGHDCAAPPRRQRLTDQRRNDRPSGRPTLRCSWQKLRGPVIYGIRIASICFLCMTNDHNRRLKDARCKGGRPWAGAKSRGAIGEATVTTRSWTPRRARNKPSNHCSGNADVWLTFIDYAHVLLPFAQEALGAARHPAFPARPTLSGVFASQLGAIVS